MLHNFKGVRTRLWGATSKNTWQKPLSQWRIHQSTSVILQQLELSIATSLYFNEEVKTDSRSNLRLWLPKCCFSHLPFEWKWRRKESQPTRLISRQFISKQFVTQANAVREKKRGRVCLSARDTFRTIYIISSLTCMADRFWLSDLVIFIFPELFTNEDDLQCLKAIGIFNQLILIHNGFFCENITKVMNKLYKWTPLALSLCIEERA